MPQEPGEKFAAKSGALGTAGERAVGAASGSRRAHTPRTPNPDTSTGTHHVRGHNDAPTNTQTKRGPTIHGHRRETTTQRHGHRKAQADSRPRTQTHKDPQTRDARAGTKTPETPAHALGPRPEPLSPGSPLLSLRAPHSGRAPGVRRRLPTPRVQEKLRGPGPAPAPSAARPLDGAAGTGPGAPAPPGDPHPPGSLRRSRLGTLTQAARLRAPGPALFSPPRGPPLPPPAVARAPHPPAPSGGPRRPPGPRPRERRQSAGLPRRAPRPPPARGAAPSPGSTRGSVSKVRTQLPPAPVGLVPGFLRPGSPPPPRESPGRLSRWPQGREHLEVAGERERERV